LQYDVFINIPVKNKTSTINREAWKTQLCTNLLELEVKAAEFTLITNCMILIGCPYSAKEVSDWQ